jgi:hypothetical protein
MTLEIFALDPVIDMQASAGAFETRTAVFKATQGTCLARRFTSGSSGDRDASNDCKHSGSKKKSCRMVGRSVS